MPAVAEETRLLMPHKPPARKVDRLFRKLGHLKLAVGYFARMDSAYPAETVTMLLTLADLALQMSLLAMVLLRPNHPILATPISRRRIHWTALSVLPWIFSCNVIEATVRTISLLFVGYYHHNKLLSIAQCNNKCNEAMQWSRMSNKCHMTHTLGCLVSLGISAMVQHAGAVTLIEEYELYFKEVADATPNATVVDQHFFGGVVAMVAQQLQPCRVGNDTLALLSNGSMAKAFDLQCSQRIIHCECFGYFGEIVGDIVVSTVNYAVMVALLNYCNALHQLEIMSMKNWLGRHGGGIITVWDMQPSRTTVRQHVFRLLQRAAGILRRWPATADPVNQLAIADAEAEGRRRRKKSSRILPILCAGSNSSSSSSSSSNSSRVDEKAKMAGDVDLNTVASSDGRSPQTRPGGDCIFYSAISSSSSSHSSVTACSREDEFFSILSSKS